MGRKLIIISFLLMLSALAAWLLWPGDEARIRRLVKEAALAAEEEDLEAVMARVSFGYRDEYGLNYVLLKRTLRERFRRYSDIAVEYEELQVEVEHDRAAAVMDVRVIATMGDARGYYIGDIREPAGLRLELGKGPTGKWLIVKSAWVSSPARRIPP